MMDILHDILLIVGGLVVGLIAGFLIAKHFMQKYLNDNPPINEKMIEAMMSNMGRKPSQKQINQVMREMNRYSSKK